jgi:hypothetical protein
MEGKKTFTNQDIIALLYNLLVSGEAESLINFAKKYPKQICMMILHLNETEIKQKRTVLATVLLSIYDNSYRELATPYRQAITHMDTVLYFDLVQDHVLEEEVDD